MNWKLFTITLACALLPLKATAGTLEIAEVGEQGLNVTVNGSPVDGITIIPIQPQPGQPPVEAWFVTLPEGYAFSPSAVDHLPYIVGEPENPDLINSISLFPGGSLTWFSDVSEPVSSNFNTFDVPENPLTIVGGVIHAIPGEDDEILDLVLADLPGTQTQSPDGGSTLALSGLALCVVGAFHSKLGK